MTRCESQCAFTTVVAIVIFSALIPTYGLAQGRPDHAPTTFDLQTATVADINGAIDAGVLSSEKLVRLYLNRIDAYDKKGPKINSVITLNPSALEEARALDVERKAKGQRSPLHGIPIVVKDLVDVAGLPTTAAFTPFHAPIPERDAAIVTRLKAAGAIILAKAPPKIGSARTASVQHTRSVPPKASEVGTPCSNPDGEAGKCGFVGEVRVAAQTSGGTSGTVNFSSDPKQSCMYVADLNNDAVYVINRQNLTELNRFGGGGRQAGELHWPHVVAVDSEGNVYVGEVDGAARVQKYLRYRAMGCSGAGDPDVGRYSP